MKYLVLALVGLMIYKILTKRHLRISTFENATIEGDELKRCLAYYEASLSLTAFQTREADLFNNTLVTYLNSMPEDPVAATEVCKAANRLVQAAHEIIRRHIEMEPIPDGASGMHLVWRATFHSFATWAGASLSAMEALANGREPHEAYLQQLVAECQAEQHKAQNEDMEFLRSLRVTRGEIAKIISRSTTLGPADSWQPNSTISTPS